MQLFFKNTFMAIIHIQSTHLKGTIWCFLVQSHSCAITTTVNSLHQKETMYPLVATPTATTNLLYVSVDLSILDISFKWNHTICGLLCLAFITQHNMFNSCCNIQQYFIYFYCQIILYYIDIPHFIYSFISDGHLSCFHFSAIMSNAVMNIHVQVFMCTYILIPLSIYLRVELLGRRVTLCFAF